MVDFSDLLILGGFGSLSYGIYEKFGLPDALMVSGGLMLTFGLLMARAIARQKDD
mgnify:CR=1 FL=1